MTQAPTVWTPRHELTFDDLERDVFGFRGQVAAGGVATLSTIDAAVVAAAFSVLDGWAAEVHLLPPDVETDTRTGVLLESSAGSAQGPASAADAEGTTRWVLYTSGTTGTPKAISHTLASLSRAVRAGGSDAFVWGLLYDPNRMAGTQVLLQALGARSGLVAPALDTPLTQRLAALRARGVTALSATPSLWRQVLQTPDASLLPLRQITLGGEIADQRVLDALASAFPDARIVHVFASTETGAAFSVRDGREGFPASYLSDPPRGIRLEIRDDVLHVYNPDASAAGPDGFASTGDIVEVVDDRVLFRGRSTGVVNVGGTNVWPERVESILRQNPDVVEAVVTAKVNPLVGNMLIARVVLADGADPAGVTKRLRSWVRDQAPKPYVPASVEVVDQLELGGTGKVTR